MNYKKTQVVISQVNSTSPVINIADGAEVGQWHGPLSPTWVNPIKNRIFTMLRNGTITSLLRPSTVQSYTVKNERQTVSPFTLSDLIENYRDKDWLANYKSPHAQFFLSERKGKASIRVVQSDDESKRTNSTPSVYIVKNERIHVLTGCLIIDQTVTPTGSQTQAKNKGQFAPYPFNMVFDYSSDANGLSGRNVPWSYPRATSDGVETELDRVLAVDVQDVASKPGATSTGNYVFLLSGTQKAALTQGGLVMYVYTPLANMEEVSIPDAGPVVFSPSFKDYSTNTKTGLHNRNDDATGFVISDKDTLAISDKKGNVLIQGTEGKPNKRSSASINPWLVMAPAAALLAYSVVKGDGNKKSDKTTDERSRLDLNSISLREKEKEDEETPRRSFK